MKNTPGRNQIKDCPEGGNADSYFAYPILNYLLTKLLILVLIDVLSLGDEGSSLTSLCIDYISMIFYEDYLFYMRTIIYILIS